jgi:hypothetical protein
MRRVRRTAGWLVALAVIAVISLFLWNIARGRPQDLPWTPLDLSEPIGMFTGRRLAALGEDFATCRSLMDKAGIEYTVLPTVTDGQCGYSDGVRFAIGGARQIDFVPQRLGIACPVAAALALWEWHVVQPAAQRHFGARVTTIDHLGSYNCRRLYSRSSGDFSQHATADAIDIAGFRLSDSRRISVLKDWSDTGPKASFLRDVRDGACDVFASTLSPDYNAAHRDHLHLDQANRGAMGWRACR